MPSLEPQAVQFAILDKDPVPDFIAHVQKMQSFSRRRLEKAASEARKEQLRAVDMTFSWDFGFEKVTGHDLAMLTNTGDPLSKSGRHYVQWARRQEAGSLPRSCKSRENPSAGAFQSR